MSGSTQTPSPPHDLSGGAPSDGGASRGSTTITIVSGGNGASGEQVVHTVLAQFPQTDVRVVTRAYVRTRPQLDAVVTGAAAERAIVVHTLVDRDLRQALIAQSAKADLKTIDLMGDLQDSVAAALGVEPLGQPGLYRKLHLDYFERVEAIDFALAHDDGMKLDELHLADIVLVGVSRVGKTPLSMFLSVLGWKTANVPLVVEIPPPDKLFAIDRRRVIGLSIEPQVLLAHRKKRQEELGMPVSGSSYVDPKKIFDEVETAEQLIRRGRFATINVSHQPIETTANQVINLIRRRFGADARKSTRQRE